MYPEEKITINEVKNLSFAVYVVIADKLLRKKCGPYDYRSEICFGNVWQLGK